MEFDTRKAQALAAMASPAPDKSPKGNIDAPIVPLLDAINLHPSYFTTSSCSGRISVLLSLPAAGSKKKAGGASWLFVSHDPADPDALVDRLFGDRNPTADGDLVFRFEPLIVAVECLDVLSAQELVATAIACGFRESGITGAGKRVMVAIRCSIRLEVPLGRSGMILVSPEYVRYLVGIANEKMEANRNRTDGFLNAFQCKVLMGSTKLKNDSDKKNEDGVVVEEGLDNLEAEQKDVLSRISSPEKEASKPDKQDWTLRYDEGMPRHSLSVVMLMIHGEPPEMLNLWGHSGCTLSNSKQAEIYLFGGFGGLGRHARRNYSLMLEANSGILKEVNMVAPPSPRLGHTSSVVGDHIYVIGGRGGPTEIFDEVWVLNTIECRWKLLKCTSGMFQPRHRHAAAVVGTNIYVFGGLNNEVIHSCMSIFNTDSSKWSKVSIEGAWPSGRHSHSLVAYGFQLFMFGGYDGENALGDLYSFDVRTFVWKKVKTRGRAPFPRFSHSMFIYKNYLGIFGGCPVRQHSAELALLNLDNYLWIHVAVDSIIRELWVRSSASVIDDDLIIVGGGASCYAFGTKFNPPMKINLSSLESVNSIFFNMEDKQGSECDMEFGERSLLCSSNSLSYLQESHINIQTELSVSEVGECFDSKHLVLRFEKRFAKLAKDILKKFRWLDADRKVQQSEDGCYIHIPVNQKICAIFHEKLYSLNTSNMDDFQQLDFSRTKNISVNEVSEPMASSILLSCGGSLLSDGAVCRQKVPKAPQKIMRDLVSSLLKDKNMPLELLEQLPTRWEHLGDIAVLPATSFKDFSWDSIGAELWPLVAKSLGAQRLARQGRIMRTGTRDSTLEILVGENGWVAHQENGILYSFDATKCMFSFGNLSEKLRMAQLDCRNEIIVDLFAGIGYFVLPFLVKAKAKLVYACEWNPHAFNALQQNVRANMVADRCIILEGDNRVTAPKGVADRVCLGLLPSSEASWVTSVRALRTEGGMLHIHGNVNDSEEDSWSKYVIEAISRIAESEGLSWHVALEHLERVKWYGPHIRHLVADVRCKLLH